MADTNSTSDRMKSAVARAKADIDAVFGGLSYARSNPALVAAYLYADALHEIDATLVEIAEMLGEVGKNVFLKLF